MAIGRWYVDRSAGCYCPDQHIHTGKNWYTATEPLMALPLPTPKALLADIGGQRGLNVRKDYANSV